MTTCMLIRLQTPVKLRFCMTTPRQTEKQLPGWLAMHVPTRRVLRLLPTLVRTRVRHMLCRLVCCVISIMTLPQTPGHSIPKSSLLSLAPTVPTLSSPVSGVHMLRALCVPPRVSDDPMHCYAWVPRIWLDNPMMSMCMLWSTVMITPWTALVRVELLHLTPESPAILLIRLAIALLNLVWYLLSAQLALLMALRSRLVVIISGFTFRLVRTRVIVSGRTTHGLLDPWCREERRTIV